MRGFHSTLNASGNGLLLYVAIERHHTRAEDLFQWGIIIWEWNTREIGKIRGTNEVKGKKRTRVEDAYLELIEGLIAVLFFSIEKLSFYHVLRTFIRRQWRGEPITLQGITTMLFEKGDLLLCFHAFGNDLHPQCFS